MRFASASHWRRGRARGSKNRRRFGLRGSTDAPKASPLGGEELLALRPAMQATNDGLVVLPLPEAAHSPLLHAFFCFPPASPIPASWAGKQKTAPMGRSKPRISLKESGAGEGIRTLDPNLGKIAVRPPMQALPLGPRRICRTPEARYTPRKLCWDLISVSVPAMHRTG